MKRRSFGSIRRLPSGRYQARYEDPLTGQRRAANTTFERKHDAETWLSRAETEISGGSWINPDAGLVSMAEFGARWIDERPNLRAGTVELYQGLFRRHVLPGLGNLSLGEITPATVRSWRRSLLDAGVGEPTVARTYRLLSAMMATAASDGMIRRSPCQIKGAGREPAPERPVATVEQVYAISDAIEPRYRALVLLTTFASLRWGETMALRRRHIDLDARIVSIEASVGERLDGRLELSPPKTAAGRRRVAIPEAIIPDLRDHLSRYAEPGSDGRVFVGPSGVTPRRTNFNRIWQRATARAGVEGLHFHDLRHSGNTLAAATGASLRELMARMGHASVRAALIYQHATADRDRHIADQLSLLAEEARAASGTLRARGEHETPAEVEGTSREGSD